MRVDGDKDLHNEWKARACSRAFLFPTLKGD